MRIASAASELNEIIWHLLGVTVFNDFWHFHEFSFFAFTIKTWIKLHENLISHFFFLFETIFCDFSL